MFNDRLQEIDYLDHGLFTELIASTLGSVFCLCGTLTFVRLSAWLSISDTYFADKNGKEGNTYNYWLWGLGDDRWLTQLLLLNASSAGALQLDPGVICETRATKSFQELFSQRRRWLLGCIATDVNANFSLAMWNKAFAMQLYRLLYQTIRVPTQFALILGVFVYLSDDCPTYLGAIIWTVYVVNWVALLCFGLASRRASTLLYPILLFSTPIFDFVLRCYAIATWRGRSWGGLRVGVGLK
jgi:cellulose synthase/poly-beta-1,6-N-acetylglucosamine synthase-like glycosyltransferase